MSTQTQETENRHGEGAVLWERRDDVVWLTLSRPEALNALTWTMYEQLEQHLAALHQDETVRAVVVRGDGGKAFAAGTDIGQFVTFTGEDGVAYEKRIDRVVQMLEELPVPTIAAIQGYAVGGGLILATACDLRFATPGSRFAAPMARTLGNCLSLDNLRRVGHAMGFMRAKELLFTARMMPAEEALSCGFLTAIVEDDALYDHVEEVAQRIAANAPLTVWSAKVAGKYLGRPDGEQAYEEVIRRVYGSADFAEGVRAYLEKRKPQWKGR